MTKEQIDSVLERVRTWPRSRQEDAVKMLLLMEAHGTDIYELSEEERAEIELSIEEARRGEFATDQEVAAVFDRYRRG